MTIRFKLGEWQNFSNIMSPTLKGVNASRYVLVPNEVLAAYLVQRLGKITYAPLRVIRGPLKRVDASSSSSLIYIVRWIYIMPRKTLS